MCATALAAKGGFETYNGERGTVRFPTFLLTAALLLEGCGPRDAPHKIERARPDVPVATASPHWDLRSTGESAVLTLASEAGATAIALSCAAGKDQLLVNVPSFKPIGSEERLSFGSGAQVVALVADPRGDRQRGGVSGSGPVPDDLKALVAGPVAVSYGAQRSGPYPAPPLDLARRFVTACFEHLIAAHQAALEAASKPTATTSACLVQDGDLLRMTPLQAVGTEPFWGARIEGRCVTYSHPDNQKGTRLWTRFNTGPQGGIWTGALGGKPFVLRTRPVVNCSDGMSDNRYQIAVDLTVNGESRHGCAGPLVK
ncbi:MAG: hypothetical protein ABI422_02055 [Sphingomicrobium sp.]